MIRFLIERPVSVLMVYLAIIVLGVVSIYKVPVSMLPNVDIPEITIQISAPTKSVKQVEESYISRIRRGLQQVSHIKEVETFAFNESGYLRLIFDHGTYLHYSFVEVNEKIDALMPKMPEEFERPRVIKASSTDIPVFYLTASLKEGIEDDLGNRFMELSEFAEQIIKRRIEQLKEVAMVDISGMEYPEIRIEADLNKLEILGFNTRVIEAALKRNNIVASNIKVRNGIYEFKVKYSSLLKDRTDIENITFESKGRIFKLSDLAKVVVKSRSDKGNILDKNGKVISMAVIKKSNARMEDLKINTEELLTAIEKDYPRLHFAISRSQTKLLDLSISNLKNSLLIGAILAFLVVFFFLKDIRSPLLIGISIPVSLIVSLLSFYILDISINIISLSGLVVGVGLMIDNSIIVIDNINQQTKNGQHNSLVGNSAAGVVEIIAPLISSALTTCAVFIPLIFLGGIAGALFYDQAISISIGLASSLVVSITLVPVLYVELMRKIRFTTTISFLENYSFLNNAYEKGYEWVTRNKLMFSLLTLLIFSGGIAAYFELKKERLPTLEQTEVVAQIDWNRNINVEENRDRVATFIKASDEYTSLVSATIGEQWYLLNRTNSLTNTEANVYFKCSSPDSLKIFQDYFIAWMNDRYPEATFKLQATENLFERIFSSDQAAIEVQLSSVGLKGYPKPEQLIEISDQIHQETGLNPLEKPVFQEVYEIRPQFDKLFLYGVDPQALINVLKTSLDHLLVFNLRQGQYEVPVTISSNTGSDLFDVIKSSKVRSEMGALLPLDELVVIKKTLGYKNLRGNDDRPYVNLPYEVPNELAAVFEEQVKQILATYTKIEAEFTGSIFKTRELLSELWIIFAIAILLLYFILASQFESLLQPLIVFIEIPIDVASAMFFLWLFGQSFNLLALIGIIVMSGIIVNDSILKIDTINRLRKEGLTVDDAIKKGGKRRLKPIVMTSATTILAMVPFLWGNDMGSVLQRPFAVAIIGGMLIGTFVSLYFIPLAYRTIYNK